MSTPRYFTSLTLPSEVGSVRKASAFLLETARNLRIPKASDPMFEVAIVEALTNAVKHGGTSHEDVIRCELELVDRTLILRIVDAGPGFALPPGAAAFPEAGPTETLAESGYGLPIIQAVFPVVKGFVREDGFCLELSVSLRPVTT